MFSKYILLMIPILLVLALPVNAASITENGTTVSVFSGSYTFTPESLQTFQTVESLLIIVFIGVGWMILKGS